MTAQFCYSRFQVKSPLSGDPVTKTDTALLVILDINVSKIMTLNLSSSGEPGVAAVMQGGWGECLSEGGTLLCLTAEA